MRMRKITISPVDYQNHIHIRETDSRLRGTTHVETYTKDEDTCGRDKDIAIFTFYPDDHRFKGETVWVD